MARIPDQLPMDAVQGPAAGGTVAPTDLGLGAAAQTYAEVAQANHQADIAQATPLLLKLRTENQTAFAVDAAAYTGAQPGFAADQIAKAQTRAQALLADPSLTPGMKLALGQGANQEIAALGNQAIDHEATVRARPIAEQTAAVLTTQKMGGMVDFLDSFGPKEDQAKANFDGSTPGLRAQLEQGFDADAAQAVANAPPAVQGQVQSALAAMKVQKVAEWTTYEQQHIAAYNLGQADTQARTAINRISSNPLAYDDVVGQILPGIVDNLPGGLGKAQRRDTLNSLTGEAATARITGLIQQGNPQQAQSELQDGRYDAFLQPRQKEELAARVDAAQRATGPKTFDQYMAAHDLEQRAQAETYARLTTGQSTGQVNLDQVAAALGPAKAAEIAGQWSAADKSFAAGGAVHDMPMAQLQAAASAAPPKPADPDYANALVAWQTQQQAAQAELKARAAGPGAWAFTVAAKPKGAAAAGDGAAQDRGAALQAQWAAYLANPSDPHLAGRFAGSSIGVQAATGIAPSAVQVIPQSEAGRLAGAVINAPPEGKLAALKTLAAVVHGLPASFQLPDGTAAAPQAILSRQLQAAHLSPVEISAIADFGTDDAKMGRFVAALNDPTLKKPLAKGEGAQLTAAVQSALAPFLASIRPLPGAQALEQARIDRTTLIARELIGSQGMNAQAAAKAAAGDVTGGYQYIDTFRVPQGVADASTVRTGANILLSQLTGNYGTNIYAPAGLPGSADDRRRLYAAQVQRSGQWTTLPDDSGLSLNVPQPDGTWRTVNDRYGRPVTATWDQLKSKVQIGGRLGANAVTAPDSFATPPPNALRAPDGQPLPAVSKSSAFAALAWAVNGQESGFKGGQASPAGALGQMQVTPATAAPYAQKLFGQPLDVNRLQHDDAYNRAIGQAALSDHINRYGPGAGIGLALAAYNAGPGRLEGYRDPKTNQWNPGWLRTIGDPRTGQISLTDFVNRIPLAETRQYVQAVLPAALGRLQAHH